MKIKRRFLSLLLAICLVAGLVPATVFAAEPESFVTSANANHWGRSDLRAYLNNAAKTDGTLQLDTMSADNDANYPWCFSDEEYALVQPWTYGTAVYDTSGNITSVYETTDRFTLPAAVGNNDYALTWGEDCDNDALSDKNRVIPISYWSGGTSSNAWLRSSLGSAENTVNISKRGDSVANFSVDKSSGVAPVFKIDLSSISFAAAASAAQVASGSDGGAEKISIAGSSDFGKSTESSLPSYGMYLKTMSQDDFDVTSVNFGSPVLTVNYTGGVAGQYVVVQAYKEDSLTDGTEVYAAAGKIVHENNPVAIDATSWGINSLDGYTIKVWMEDGSGARLAAATTPVTFVGVDSSIMQTTSGAAENLRVFAEKDKLQTSWGDLSALSEADWENVAKGQPTSAGIVAGANPTNQKIYFGEYEGTPLEFWIAGRETAANGGSISADGEILTLYQAKAMYIKRAYNSDSAGYNGNSAITLRLTDGLTLTAAAGSAASYPAESITLTGQDGLDKSNLQFQYRSTGESAWSDGMPSAAGTYELRCYLPGTDNYERTYSAPVTVTVHEHNWSDTWSSDGSCHWHECTVAGCPITDNSQKDGYAVHSYDQQVVSDTYLASAANCTAPAKYYYSCVCGAKGTETFENGDALGHKWGSWRSNGDDTHTRTCSTCGDTESQNCSGGEATCMATAVCAVCGQPYGEKDPTNHTGTEAWITTDTTHTKVWRCCQAVIKAEEEHNWENGTCTICQYPCHHTGGTATCSQLAQCELCGSLYGDLDPDNHLAESEWIQENGKHYHRCAYGCDAHLDEAECSGGTATCTAQALCAVCGGAYGAVDPANHANLVKTEAKAATHLTEGNIEYWYCDGCDKYFRDQAATEEIADLSEIVIPKLSEHTPDNTGWHSDDNNHWNTCACDAKLNEAAHTFEWVTDKQPTETEAGSKHEECTVCGYAKAAVEIPATGTTTPSTSPAPTSSPGATTTPAPTASPDATTTPAPTGTSGATATPAPTAEPETGTGPKTGDDTNAAPWAALLLAAGAALTGTALYSRKRKQNG